VNQAERRAGLLLHPTSLPGPHGMGDLGREAYAWVDFLEAAGQRVWQVMPLGPTGYGDSPYQCFSAFAGNHFLIDLLALSTEDLLTAEELAPLRALPRDRVDFGAFIPVKLELLGAAARRFDATATTPQRAAVAEFEAKHAAWLPDHALFMALKEENGGAAWTEWAPELRDRDASALARARERLAPAVAKHVLWQYWFYTQWGELRTYANSRDIVILGDVPIFVALDSTDAWSHPEQYFLGPDGNPIVVAGVPPDYFSATGQRWGNPLYRWDVMAQDGYAWWVARVRAALELVDRVRVDHFRAFAGYWEIPAAEVTAVNGRWAPGPGQALFDALKAGLGDLPLVAEDLGVITPDVDALRLANGLPGMKVLQFAFAGDADDPYLPHNYEANCVVYTGTHDNDTSAGWYEAASEAERDLVRRYLAKGDENIAWELVRLALASVAATAIAPMQDALGLSSAARMNTPGTAAGNWSWRFEWTDVPYWLAPQLRELAELYGRVPGGGGADTPYRQSVTD